MSDYILLNIVSILAITYMLCKTRHACHMLQLESYKNKRYFKWIRNNKTVLIRELFLIPLFIFTFFYKQIGIIINIIFFVVLILTRKKHIEKKPLVYTDRVKRIYITEILISVLILILINIFKNTYIIITLDLMIIFNYIFIMIINFINSPVEKAIQYKFYRKAKQKLAENPNLKVIGVTGSYGKTSTKYILGTILSQKYNTLITPESYNTTMGVVRTINENLNNTHQVFVCEMGAKNVGDIKEICDLVKPEYGVVTAVGPQHLETFKNIENVKKTKFELVESLPSTGISFTNNEDENIKSVKIDKKNIKYGFNKDCDFYADNIQVDGFGSSFDVYSKKTEKVLHIKTKILGKHNIINIIGATAVASELGLNEEEIVRGTRFLKPVMHRLELKKNPNGSIIIDDAYNSNVKGAEAALDVLGSFKNMQKILITPGIVDLGNKTHEYNKEFGKQAAKSCDYIILVGEKQAIPIYEGLKEKGYSQEKVYIAKDLADALNKMNQKMNENTVVLFENDLPDNYL